MAEKRRTQRSEYIITGNAVRKVSAAPERAPHPYKSREQLRREAEGRRAAKRNQEASRTMNRGYVAFLTVATVVCFSACAMLIHMQSQVTSSMSEVASLQKQISDQQADNTATEKRLETQMNLEEIKEKAQSMGLDYPDSDQIQYYSVENGDYMNQYGEVADK